MKLLRSALFLHLAFALLLAGNAVADVTIQMGFGPIAPTNVPNHPCEAIYAGTSQDAVAIANTFNNDCGSNAAAANLSSGTLRTSSSRTDLESPGSYAAAYAIAKLADTFSFTGTSSEQAFLDWSLDGTLTTTGYVNYYVYGAKLVINVWNPTSVGNGSTGTTEQHYVLAPSGSCSLYVLAGLTSCVDNVNSIDLQGSIPIDIYSGEYSIDVTLTVTAMDRETVNFLNTGRLYLRTPDGVGIESTSGVFLATATPILDNGTNPAPEPATLALLGLGLAGLGFSRRKQ